MTRRTEAILGLFLLSSSVMAAQTTTTNTNCNVYGNAANCTSTTTDNSAQQQRSYEAGQQVGNALGAGIALAAQAHARNSWVKKFFARNPGQSCNWTRNSDGALLGSGHCPTDEDKGVMAANEFMSHHKDFIKCPENSGAVADYIGSHSLDPRVEKSYEHAYKDLKKDGKLQLYRN